jgi:hypothetical protein
VSVFIGPPDCGDLETVRRYYRNLPGKIFDFTDVSDITEVDLLEKTIKLDGSFENIDTSNLKTKLTAFLNTLDMAERPIVIAYLPEKKDESSKARSSAEAINVWVQTGFRVVVVTHDAAVLSAINAQRNTRVSSQTVAYSDSADRASKIAKYLLSDKSGIAHRFKGQANRLKILSESIDAKDAIDLIRFSKSYTGKNDPVDLWLRNKLLESHFAWTKAIASFPTLGRSSAAELTEGMAFVSNKLEQLPSNRKLLPYLLKSGVLWKTDESYYSYYTPTLMELAWRMYGGKALHLHCGWCDSDIFEEIRSARTTPKA